MINYKEKYLKYKKKYLKIRKMFGGSGSGLPIKKVATYDNVPQEEFDPIKPYSIPSDPLFQDPRKRIVDIVDDEKEEIMQENVNRANEEVKKQLRLDDERIRLEKVEEQLRLDDEGMRLEKVAQENKLYDERMDIEYDNSANYKVRTQEMEAVRHAVLPLAVLDEIFAKGGLEKTRVKGRYKSNNSNSNKNSLLFGGGILIAAITSVILLLK